MKLPEAFSGSTAYIYGTLNDVIWIFEEIKWRRCLMFSWHQQVRLLTRQLSYLPVYSLRHQNRFSASCEVGHWVNVDEHLSSRIEVMSLSPRTNSDETWKRFFWTFLFLSIITNLCSISDCEVEVTGLEIDLHLRFSSWSSRSRRSYSLKRRSYLPWQF